MNCENMLLERYNDFIDTLNDELNIPLLTNETSSDTCEIQR